MINLTRVGALKRFQKGIEELPQRGEGLHVAILSIANWGVAAGFSEEKLVEMISAIDRPFKKNEVIEAVAKAFRDAEDQSNGGPREYKARAAMTKAAAAGRILAKDKERAAQLQAALIAKGGGSVDPFSPELHAMSNPQFELVPPLAGIPGSEHRRDMLVFLKTAFEDGASLYIGNGLEARRYQRDHVKLIADWVSVFEQELDAIDNEPDPQEQQQMISDLGDRYPFFVINPLVGTPDERRSLRSNACVKEPRHLLCESDSLPLEQQIALMCGLNLPVKSLVFSGGKSVHALVDVAHIPGGESVVDLESWNVIVKRDYFGQLAPLGFDKATSNPARLSRLPGIYRSDKGTFQQLLYLDQNGGSLHA